MSDTTKEVDPLADKILTLEFSVKDINGILNLLGTLPFMQVVSLINEIQAQCTPQVRALNAASEIQTGAPIDAEERN